MGDLGCVLKGGWRRVALLVWLWAAVAQAAEVTESEEELFRRGRELYQSRQYDQAADCFSKAISVNASDARYYDWRGLAYLHKSDADKALKDIEQALRLDARLAGAYLHRGYIHLHRKSFQRAVADFTRAIEIDGDDVVAYHALCVRSFAKCEITRPTEYRRQANRGDPPGMADVLLAIKLRPEAPDAYMFRGDLFFVYLEDWSRAKEDYDKAIAIDPMRMDFLWRRGMLRRKLDEPVKKVLADLNAAIALNRKYAPPYMALDFDVELAKAYSDRGIHAHGEQAVRDFKEAIRLSPNDVLARTNLAIEYAKEAETLDDALREFGRVIEIDPEFRQAYTDRGCVLADQGRLDEALADFTEAIRLEPENARGYHDLGTVYDETHRLPEAVEAFSKAISLNPDKHGYYISRGAVYVDLEEYDKAIADSSTAIRLAPNYFEGWVNRGTAYTKNGEWEKAIADFSKDIELRPFSSGAYARRAAAYKATGQLDQAEADEQEAEFNSGPLDEILQRIHLIRRGE